MHFMCYNTIFNNIHLNFKKIKKKINKLDYDSEDLALRANSTQMYFELFDHKKRLARRYDACHSSDMQSQNLNNWAAMLHS